jgi:tryptophanyl-tRNA synthetase
VGHHNRPNIGDHGTLVHLTLKNSLEPTSVSRERVVTGIRATGRMHLGNYLGAVRTFVDLTSRVDREGYFFIADLHTLTTLRDPDVLRTQLPEIVLDYLAAGIDPERVTVFVQSGVPETSELAWLLSSVTYVGELERVPSYRERERRRAESEPISAGLLNYPLLMAADILGPRAHRVPVGEDQYPHLELVRDIARRFNRRFFSGLDPFFPEPQPVAGEPVRVPGLDGSGKMGKSEGNAIAIMDEPSVRWQKLAPAVTDPARRTRSDPGVPERCGIYAIHQLVSPRSRVEEVAEGCRTAALGCIDCKQRLDVSIENLVRPIRERRVELAAKPERIREVLHEGAVRARTIVRETRDMVQDKVGIVRY